MPSKGLGLRSSIRRALPTEVAFLAPPLEITGMPLFFVFILRVFVFVFVFVVVVVFVCVPRPWAWSSSIGFALAFFFIKNKFFWGPQRADRYLLNRLHEPRGTKNGAHTKKVIIDKNESIRPVTKEGQKFEIPEDPGQTLPARSPMDPIW